MILQSTVLSNELTFIINFSPLIQPRMISSKLLKFVLTCLVKNVIYNAPNIIANPPKNMTFKIGTKETSIASVIPTLQGIQNWIALLSTVRINR